MAKCAHASAGSRPRANDPALVSGQVERSVDGAPEVLRRLRRLLAYYRTSEPVLPPWVEAFVTTGYAHYCTLLPTAFTDCSSTCMAA